MVIFNLHQNFVVPCFTSANFRFSMGCIPRDAGRLSTPARKVVFTGKGSTIAQTQAC